MADSTPPTNGNGEPPKIRLDASGADKSATSPIGETRVPTPSGTPPRISIRPPERKVETTRIDLAEAKPSPKIETQRISISDAAKAATMRVEIVDSAHKVETARIDLPASKVAKPAESSTASDVFKRSTVPVGVPTPVPPVTRPKTIQVRKPVAPPEPPVLTPPAPQAEAEAKKSETARIDLPADSGAERPATRPKTIRIKRPDGTTARKALTIARPSEQTTPAAKASPAAGSVGEGEEIGGLYGVFALVALLVVCVLVYVLAAQTVAPTLPFPGRL